MTIRALALSPHLDDAAFSCGGTLAMLPAAGWKVTVATLFTQSVPNPKGFALACQLDKGLDADVDYMALRRAEDASAMRALGVTSFVHVPLPEAPHRGYENASALFEAPREDDTIEHELRTVIDDLLRDTAPDLILAPQAIGGHVDHVQVVRSLSGIDRPVVWWRDFPYVAQTMHPAEPFATRMHALPDRCVRLNDAAVMSREAACLAYESQIGFQFGGPERLVTKLRTCGSAEHFRALHSLPV